MLDLKVAHITGIEFVEVLMLFLQLKELLAIKSATPYEILTFKLHVIELLFLLIK